MRSYKELPSQEYLRQCFSYDYVTGILTWKERPLSHFQSERSMRVWNKMYAGKPTGKATNHGYKTVRVAGTAYQAHRLIHCLVTGEDPGNRPVDHINHNRSDNRWSNLQVVEDADVNKNKPRRRDNASGVTGVSWHKQHAKWQARIVVAGVTKHLLYADDFEDAVAARKAAERLYGYHPNHGSQAA